SLTPPTARTRVAPLWNVAPRRVRAVDGHRGRRGTGLRAEILLANDTVLTDDEGHDAGGVVLDRPRDERESARHLAVLYVRYGPARRARALAGQDLEVVPVKRRRRLATLGDRAAFCRRLRHEVAERTRLAATLGRPIQPVLSSGIAAKCHRVQARAFSIVFVLRVAPLGGDVGPADFNHRKLVAADPAREDFFLSRRGVESPRARVVHQRHWKRPSFFADDEDLAVGALV